MKNSRRLSLHRETVRELSSGVLRHVAGAGSHPGECSNYISCNNPLGCVRLQSLKCPTTLCNTPAI